MLADLVREYEVAMCICVELQLIDAFGILCKVVDVVPQLTVGLFERMLVGKYVVLLHDCREYLRLVCHQHLLDWLDTL